MEPSSQMTFNELYVNALVTRLEGMPAAQVAKEAGEITVQVLVARHAFEKVRIQHESLEAPTEMSLFELSRDNKHNFSHITPVVVRHLVETKEIGNFLVRTIDYLEQIDTDTKRLLELIVHFIDQIFISKAALSSIFELERVIEVKVKESDLYKNLSELYRDAKSRYDQEKEEWQKKATEWTKKESEWTKKESEWSKERAELGSRYEYEKNERFKAEQDRLRASEVNKSQAEEMAKLASVNEKIRQENQALAEDNVDKKEKLSKVPQDIEEVRAEAERVSAHVKKTQLENEKLKRDLKKAQEEKDAAEEERTKSVAELADLRRKAAEDASLASKKLSDEVTKVGKELTHVFQAKMKMEVAKAEKRGAAGAAGAAGAPEAVPEESMEMIRNRNLVKELSDKLEQAEKELKEEKENNRKAWEAEEKKFQEFIQKANDKEERNIASARAQERASAEEELKVKMTQREGMESSELKSLRENLRMETEGRRKDAHEFAKSAELNRKRASNVQSAYEELTKRLKTNDFDSLDLRVKEINGTLVCIKAMSS